MERVVSPVQVGKGPSDHGPELGHIGHGPAPRRLRRRQRRPTSCGTFRATAQHRAPAIESERAVRHPVTTTSRLAVTPSTISAPTSRRRPGSASCGRTRACRRCWSMRSHSPRSHRCAHDARSSVGGCTRPSCRGPRRFTASRVPVPTPTAVQASADLVPESGPPVEPTAPILDSRGSPNGKLPRRPDR